MKKTILTLFALLMLLGAKAQESQKEQEEKADTLKIKWRNSRIWIFDLEKSEAKKDTSKKKTHTYGKNDFAHWGGIDLGVSMLTTIDNKTSLSEDLDTTQINNFLNLKYGKSLFFSFNLIEQNFRLYKNYLMLTTGAGVEWSSYNFEKNITLNPDAPYISSSNLIIAADSIKYSKNKLRICYLKVPLLLEFNTNAINPKKSFHIAGGFEFAYKLGSKTKQKYEINGYEIKSSRRDDYHLADFKYSTVLRVGYGDHFNLFANYGLSQLFENNKGPDVFPFTMGVAFNF